MQISRLFLALLLFVCRSRERPTVQSLPEVPPAANSGFDAERLGRIDSICMEAIDRQATPGCVVLVAKGGKIAYEKAFELSGPMTRPSRWIRGRSTIWPPVPRSARHDHGRHEIIRAGEARSIPKTLGHYLPWVRGQRQGFPADMGCTAAPGRVLRPLFLFLRKRSIPAAAVCPLPGIYTSLTRIACIRIRVAESLVYAEGLGEDTFVRMRILQSPAGSGRQIRVRS